MKEIRYINNVKDPILIWLLVAFSGACFVCPVTVTTYTLHNKKVIKTLSESIRTG